MDTGRKVRVDETPCVSGDTDIGARVCGGAVRPIRCLFDLCDELALVKNLQGVRREFQRLLVEFGAGWGSQSLLFLDRQVLSHDGPDRHGSVVQWYAPGPAARI